MAAKIPPTRRTPVKRGVRNLHFDHIMGVAKGEISIRERPAISYFGLGQDIYTTRKAINRHKAAFVGNIHIKSIEGDNVVVEHRLRVGQNFKEVPERRANEVEKVVREHFSPMKVKFIRK